MGKHKLPRKTFAVCDRSFFLAKKLEKVLFEVKYCSERCRINRAKLNNEYGDKHEK